MGGRMGGGICRLAVVAFPRHFATRFALFAAASRGVVTFCCPTCITRYQACLLDLLSVLSAPALPRAVPLVRARWLLCRETSASKQWLADFVTLAVPFTHPPPYHTREYAWRGCGVGDHRPPGG
jgi:hypothetical protein